MLVLVFWFHLSAVLLLTLSLTADLFLPVASFGFERSRSALKLSLLIWSLLYAFFYFLYAFFPQTEDSSYTILSLVSLAIASILAASLLVYTHRLSAPSSSLTLPLVTAVLLILLGTLSVVSGSEPIIRTYLHLYYGGIILSLLLAMIRSRYTTGLQTHQRRTLLVLLFGFVLIAIDHLYVNFTLQSDPLVTEGIITAGLLALSLAILDLRLVVVYLKSGRAAVSEVAALPEGLVRTFQLTEREAEIGYLISRGKSAREIAEELFISQKTVEAHTYNIYQKTQVSRRAAFIVLVESYRS